MKYICLHDKCTGCGACVNACVHHCISLKEDNFGELHPEIDVDACVDCGLCYHACPNNCEQTFNYPSHCYAAWINDIEKRKECASGGLATILSEYIIKQKHGVVFGTAYDKDLRPTTMYVDKIEDLNKFKGSKYVHSFVGDNIFVQIKKFLQNGRCVMYISTPCQIAGLLTYLKKSYENLITVDLICHGVTPFLYFKKEVEYICKEKGIKNRDITNIRFRGNDYSYSKGLNIVRKSNNFQFTIWTDNTTKCSYRGGADSNYYLAGFLQNITLRENCFSCLYARPDRISDITIGDFIGLGSERPFKHIAHNVSSLTTNTPKGIDYYNEVCKMTQVLYSEERDYNERLNYKPSLLEPSNMSELRPVFLKLYLEHGYLDAIHTTLKKYMNEERRKRMKHHILYPYSLIVRIGKKLMRIQKKMLY